MVGSLFLFNFLRVVNFVFFLIIFLFFIFSLTFTKISFCRCFILKVKFPKNYITFLKLCWLYFQNHKKWHFQNKIDKKRESFFLEFYSCFNTLLITYNFIKLKKVIWFFFILQYLKKETQPLRMDNPPWPWIACELFIWFLTDYCCSKPDKKFQMLLKDSLFHCEYWCNTIFLPLFDRF